MKLPVSIKSIVLGLGVTFSMGSALAVPLITEWKVEQEFEFTSWTDDGGANPTDGITATGNSVSTDNFNTAAVDPTDFVAGKTKLEWGNTTKSSLVINPGVPTTTPSNLTVVNASVPTQTGGSLDFTDFRLGPNLTHNNFVIGGQSLDTAVGTDYVQLGSVSPFAGLNQARSLAFDVFFEETNNSLTGTDCPSGNPGNGCRDIFAIAGIDGTPVAVANTASLAFAIDSFLIPGDVPGEATEYTVYLLADGLGPLGAATCGKTGVNDPGCLGFVTTENQVNSFQLYFGIAAETVEVIPEPAALVLIALGLLMMGGVRARKGMSA